ncbi:MAG: hypothetical protein CIT01_00145 [Methanobacterium sp. BRmetb2]|nr:MAG: hypothetical protein CIT01_00145 [Methanobacterium sp. BRmetb2]
MRIAIIGSRGIPAKYGGFETFAEGLSTRLVEKGYDVTVSCEYQDPNERFEDYHGVKLSYFPLKPPNSYFFRKIYENLSDIYFLFKLTHKNDVIYFLGTEVGMFLFIPKLLKRNIKLMVNIDGVMWKRTKFNRLERWLLKINHNFATRFSDVIVADAEEMKKYVNSKYRNKAVFIPYGVEEVEPVKWDINKLKNIESFSNINISKNKFWLVVARLEPENNIHMIVEGFSRANSKYPLVIVGDFTGEKYEKEIKDIVSGSSNIHLVGSIYDLELLNMLRQHNFAYIHGHSVGGTNPSLLEAMIMKSIIVAHDNGFNREVCGDSVFYFSNEEDLKNKVVLLENLKNNETMKKTFNTVKKTYLWDKVIGRYEFYL